MSVWARAPRSTDRERVPYPPENYVGTVIAPKAMVPVAAFASAGIRQDEWEFRCFSPDQARSVGKGYFAEEGPRHCARQHMHPGLASPGLQGSGLGTAMYLAGNMTIAAMKDNATGDFPWRDPGLEACTFSHDTGRGGDEDRTKSAKAVWTNLVRYGLATRTEYPEEESVFVDLEFMGVSDLNRKRVIDFMDWETVKSSGLVVHTGWFFDPHQRAFVPPATFAALDWTFTRERQLIEFAQQNATLSGDPNAWMLEAACHLSALQPERADLLLQQTRQKRFPNQCPVVFRADDRAWDRQWGDFEEDGEPRTKKLKARLLR